MPLGTCVAKQRAAQKKLNRIYKSKVRQPCINETKQYDRKAAMTDYIAAEKCAQREQARQDKTYDSRKCEGTIIFYVVFKGFYHIVKG
jgi:hypothetical protein